MEMANYIVDSVLKHTARVRLTLFREAGIKAGREGDVS